MIETHVLYKISQSGISKLLYNKEQAKKTAMTLLYYYCCRFKIQFIFNIPAYIVKKNNDIITIWTNNPNL